MNSLRLSCFSKHDLHLFFPSTLTFDHRKVSFPTCQFICCYWRVKRLSSELELVQMLNALERIYPTFLHLRSILRAAFILIPPLHLNKSTVSVLQWGILQKKPYLACPEQVLITGNTCPY